MKLEHFLTYRAELAQPVAVGAGPFGMRQIFDVTGGRFEGPKLRGKLLPSGGDWILIGADGFGRLDVRATLATDDGALIYMQYYGVLDFAQAMAILGRGGETRFGELYFMTAPRMETGDARYDWLNKLVCVAEGRLGAGWVEYRVHQLANG